MVVLNCNALDLCLLGINIDDRITGERASHLRDMRGRCWIDVSRLSHATRIDDDLAVHRNLARDMAVRAENYPGANRTRSVANFIGRCLNESAMFDIFEQIGVVVVRTAVKREDVIAQFERGWQGSQPVQASRPESRKCVGIASVLSVLWPIGHPSVVIATNSGPPQRH